MNILIISFPSDLHATAVTWALERRGARVSQWYLSDFPARQTVSLLVGEAQPGLEVQSRETDIRTLQFDAVWNRRASQPTLHADLAAEDRGPAWNDCQTFLNAARALATTECFAVNTYGSQLAANMKPVQLRAAQLAGLNVPPTLISNDFVAVEAFAARCGGTVLVKPLTPAVWKGEHSEFHPFATRRQPSDLDRESVAAAPAIYQPYVEKAHELRVTVMGRSLLAARLHSQESQHGQEDWRVDNGRTMRVTPENLPSELQSRIHDFMDRMGLTFGALDFIVTPEGEYVFLEVNESGQFLWVEELCPEIPMLDAFTGLMLSGRPDFRYRPGPNPIRFSDYKETEDYADHNNPVRSVDRPAYETHRIHREPAQ